MSRLFDPSPQFNDSSGRPLASGSLTFYATGTTTPQNTWSVEALTPGQENANPLSLNSAGRSTTEVWLDDSLSYRVVLKDSSGATVWDRDPWNELGISITGLNLAADVENIAALKLLGGATNGDIILMAGYYTRGDGGGGEFYWDSSSTATDNGGTIIKVTAVTTGRWLLLHNGTISIKQFGAKGDGTTDDWAAVNAICNLALVTTANASISYGPVIEVPQPPVAYRMSQELNINMIIRMTGRSGVYNTGSYPFPCEFRFDASTDGFIVNNFNTNDNTSGVFIGSSGSIIENISITGSGSGTHRGFRARTYCVARNVLVKGFPDNGFHCTANSAGSGASAGATNLIRLEYCESRENGGHGYYFDNVDANAGLISGCSADSNTGIGFYDSSLLGNTWVACHATGNTGGSYKSDDVNASALFLGCYHENNQPAPVFAIQTLVIGGNVTAAFTSAGGSGGVIGPAGWLGNVGFAVRHNVAGTNQDILTRIDGTSDPATADNLVNISSIGNNGIGLDYVQGVIAMRYGNSNAAISQMFTTGLNSGGLDKVTVTAGGTGYTVAPTISFTPISGGSGAAATATVSGGVVTAITLTAAGSGYAGGATVVITPVSGGSGATATAGYARSITAGTGAAIASGMTAFPTGLYLGPQETSSLTDDTRRVFVADAAPTTGLHARGERVFNRTPTVGQPKGWICSVTGTPGTWVSEGNL